MLKPKSKTEIKITGAKGRPMLHWVGKRPLDFLEAFPAQPIEKFGTLERQESGWEEWPPAYPHGGVLLHGDNKECLAHLLHAGFRGQVKLIYIDPPFDSGADYVRKVQLRGLKGQAMMEGQSYSLGEQLQYTDIWANDNYLQFMFERLLLLKELLSEDGSIYLHCDWHKSHHLRCLMDEVFGMDNFVNEITWQRFNYRADGKKFGAVHDTLLLYRKGANYTFNKPYLSLKASYIKSHFKPDADGRLFRLDNLTAPGHGKTGKAMKFGDREIAPPIGTMWRFVQETITELWDADKIVIPEDGVPQVVRRLDEIDGQAAHTIWTDVGLNSQSAERVDYPTQKPEALLERIIETSSEDGDIVLDSFLGSGTTAVAAQRLGRRFIGCDINKGAIQTASKRLQNVITAQKNLNGKIIEDGLPVPAQLGFTVARVNDYDLNVQHLEAVELACARAGVTRTRSDSFFDGTLGEKLVKVVPFQHPLSPADIESVKNELKTRPDETRSITLVALGVESAARVSLQEHNQFSVAARIDAKGNAIDFINKIEALDLRDGGFFVHQNATARVEITRVETKDGPNAKIEIQDFLSPTILTRLQADSNLFQARADGWKSCVDCVLIDLNHSGELFNVSHSDIPAKKDSLVSGKYELPIAKEPVTIAVKIIDLLGEEIVVTQTI